MEWLSPLCTLSPSRRTLRGYLLGRMSETLVSQTGLETCISKEDILAIVGFAP
jgi:hypothetical protein